MPCGTYAIFFEERRSVVNVAERHVSRKRTRIEKKFPAISVSIKVTSKEQKKQPELAY